MWWVEDEDEDEDLVMVGQNGEHFCDGGVGLGPAGEADDGRGAGAAD